jgi:prevent-host-death family protein
MTMVTKAKPAAKTRTKTSVRQTRTVTASEFKARCLQLMDEVNASGEEIVITKRGKPVSRLVPYRVRPASLIGLFAGQMKILGDIIEPIDVEWEANR